MPMQPHREICKQVYRNRQHNITSYASSSTSHHVGSTREITDSKGTRRDKYVVMQGSKVETKDPIIDSVQHYQQQQEE